MPRRIGTRTAAQSASTALVAAASPLLLQSFRAGWRPTGNKNGRSRGRPRDLLQTEQDQRRNFPPLAESTTIAAMLRAMAMTPVMANSEVHMAYPPRWRNCAREVWPGQRTGLAIVPGFLGPDAEFW